MLSINKEYNLSVILQSVPNSKEISQIKPISMKPEVKEIKRKVEGVSAIKKSNYNSKKGGILDCKG
jgi:hypothetical protein